MDRFEVIELLQSIPGGQIWYSGIEFEGERKVWYSNGQIAEHSHWLHGSIVGEYKTWYDNGNLRFHVYYKKDKHVFDGEYKYWYNNGQLAVECFYKNDYLEGRKTIWDSFGVIIFQGIR